MSSSSVIGYTPIFVHVGQGGCEGQTGGHAGHPDGVGVCDSCIGSDGLYGGRDSCIGSNGLYGGRKGGCKLALQGMSCSYSRHMGNSGGGGRQLVLGS